jgi:hypothetical protein
MKKLLLMSAALLCMSGLFAKKVAFIVDMNGQTVSPNGVHVAGNFQGWNPSTTSLINAPILPPNFYGMVLDIPANQVIEFKIINGNDWPFAESVPAISQKGYAGTNGQQNDNRWMYIDSMANDTTMIMLKYGASAPMGKYAVRFAVDMQKEASVSADGVHLAGSLQGWNPATTRMTNLYDNKNKIYEIILTLDSATYQYKYVNGKAWGSDESVPSACNVGNNREIAVKSDLTAPKVCYASCIACPTAPIPTYALTFQVDMSSSDCDGGFDSVTVAGAGAKLTGFGAGLKMSKVGSTGVYSITVADLDSGEVSFKYRFHKNGNTNWEGGSNRTLALAKNDTTPITCFNSRVVGNCPSKPAPSKITFIVDFTKTVTPPASKIYLMGDFTKPQWQDGAKEMTQITGKPGIYTVTIDSICPGKLAYRFSNGDPKATGTGEPLDDSTATPCVEPNGVGGFNRAYVRTVATDVTISKLWNSCDAGFVPSSSVSELANISNLVKLYPNPTSTFTVVEFNDAAKLHNVIMMDVTGRVVRTIENYDLSTLRIDKEDLKQGVYMINITNNLNQSANVKLVIE